MHKLMETIVRMGIFMICAQVLIHFRPNGSYEKYMKLLVSVMILAQLFFPVMNLFLGEGQQMEDLVVQFQEQMEESRKEALSNVGEVEGLMDRITSRELERQLKLQEESREETGSDGSEAGSGQEDATEMIDPGIQKIEIKVGKETQKEGDTCEREA